MPKPRLQEPEETLEKWLIKAMHEGLAEWRPDLDYPASFSDMESLARGVLRRFKIEVRLEKIDLPIRD